MLQCLTKKIFSCSSNTTPYTYIYYSVCSIVEEWYQLIATLCIVIKLFFKPVQGLIGCYISLF